jgi:flotillin
LALKTAELQVKSDTAKAEADAAYSLEQQKRNEEIGVATTNAEIAKTEREVALSEQQAAVRENQLNAEIKKKADADRYATEVKAQAALFERQKAAEAEKYELQQKAEIQKIQAEADKEAKAQAAAALEIQAKAEANAQIAKAEAAKQAALAEAAGIEAKGKAEAEAIQKKADAMDKYSKAATLKLVLDSNIIPQSIESYAKPMAESMSKIGNITMFGEGNTSKLVGEMTKNGTQIVDGLNNAFGIDIKSLVSGLFGGVIASEAQDKPEDTATATKAEDKGSK